MYQVKQHQKHGSQKLEQQAIHNWYRFVLSYPDHLVREMIERFEIHDGNKVLDPFVGTGTTLVECKKRGISSIGIDANPVTVFASKVKTTWNIDLDEFERRRVKFLRELKENLGGKQFGGISKANQLSFDDLLATDSLTPVDQEAISEILSIVPKHSISEVPLQKVLIARDLIDELPNDEITDIFRLLLATAAVEDMSNLGFGPEIYVKRSKKKDADIYGAFSRKLRRARRDLKLVQEIPQHGFSAVYRGDSRTLSELEGIGKVDFVITSPPYPNEKDYTRITRLELALLSFVKDRKSLRAIKEDMLRSHTRNIYKDDDDSQYVKDISEIGEIAEEIEQKRIERNGTSGFEKLYHRVVTEYFGGMYRVLRELQRVLKPGAKVALVVGDQMSFYRIPIRTAELLSLMARRKLNYSEVETLLWRDRMATVTGKKIEEHILTLQYLG